MNDFTEWAQRYPQAAAALAQVLGPVCQPGEVTARTGSEAAAQQRARLNVAGQGAMAWRNNVGATPAKVQSTCPRCQFRHEEKQTPIRYGLANDSQKLNKSIKSSDLILAIPRVITPQMVGETIAQFGAVECKRPGWQYRGTKDEAAQLAWLTLIRKLGGFARFSTGGVEL